MFRVDTYQGEAEGGRLEVDTYQGGGREGEV